MVGRGKSKSQSGQDADGRAPAGRHPSAGQADHLVAEVRSTPKRGRSARRRRRRLAPCFAPSENVRGLRRPPNSPPPPPPPPPPLPSPPPPALTRPGAPAASQTHPTPPSIVGLSPASVAPTAGAGLLPPPPRPHSVSLRARSQPGRRRDCHFADAPSPFLLKHLPKGEGMPAKS